MRIGLSARNVISTSLVTLAICGSLGLFFLTQLSILEVRQAQNDASALTRQFMTLGSLRLSGVDSADEALVRLGSDPVLAQFLQTVQAGSPYVVYAALAAPDGSTVISSNHGIADDIETQDFEQLTDRNAVGRVFSLLKKGQLFAATTPVAHGDEEIGNFVLLIDTSLIRDNLRSILLDSAWIIVIALAIAWLAAIATAMLTRRLVRKIQLQIDRLRAGDFDFEPVPLSEPGFERLAGQLRNLGQEFKSERLELLAEKKSLEQVLQHIQLGVMVLDEDERIMFFNAPLEPVVGTTIEEAMGRPIEQHLDSANPLRKVLRHAERQNQDLDALRVSLPTTGRFRESMISVFSLAVEGSPRGAVLLLEDLTGYKALMALADYGAFASEINRHLSEIVHDIRTPLSTLLSHVEIIKCTGDQQQATRSADAIEKSIKELGSLLETLLDYLHRKPLETSNMDLCELIQEVTDFYRPDMEKHAIEVSLDLKVSPCLIEGDEKSLRQVLTNLMSNAVDAMPDGGRLEIRTGTTEDGAMKLEVHDSGKGIKPEDTEKVFKLYYTSKPSGRGIGLAIAQRTVTEHGGKITVDSSPADGTTFTIELPAVKNRRAAADAAVEKTT